MGEDGDLDRVLQRFEVHGDPLDVADLVPCLKGLPSIGAQNLVDRDANTGLACGLIEQGFRWRERARERGEHGKPATAADGELSHWPVNSQNAQTEVLPATLSDGANGGAGAHDDTPRRDGQLDERLAHAAVKLAVLQTDGASAIEQPRTNDVPMRE